MPEESGVKPRDLAGPADSANVVGAPGTGRQGPPRWVWWVFSVVFLGLGSFFLVMVGVLPVWRVLHASGWAATPCTVLSSELKEIDDTDSDGANTQTYKIAIHYKYVFAGAPHESDHYDFLDLASNTNTAAKRGIVKANPPGKRTVCYVNPANPNEAVLERGWTGDMWWGLFPIPFVLIGLCALVFGALGWRPRKKPAVDESQVE